MFFVFNIFKTLRKSLGSDVNIFFTEIAFDFGWSGATLVHCVEKESSLHEITNKRQTLGHQLKDKVQEKMH